MHPGKCFYFQTCGNTNFNFGVTSINIYFKFSFTEINGVKPLCKSIEIIPVKKTFPKQVDKSQKKLFRKPD